MNNNTFKVLGLICGVSKNNVPYTMLQVSRPFSGNTAKQVRIGEEVISQYIEGDFSKSVSVGATIQFEYTLNSGGYPSVCGVHVVK